MIVETWHRIKELDLVDPDTGRIIRYTMRTNSGKEKYIYFDDMINELKYKLKNTKSSRELETKRQELQTKFLKI